VVVNDGRRIVADRQITDGCLAIAIAGFGNADRVAEDKDSRSSPCCHLRRARIEAAGVKLLVRPKPGRSDRAFPRSQNQGGATLRAASRRRSPNSVAAMNSRCRRHRQLPFSGAAALDGDGKFAGIALLRPVIVAGRLPTPERKRCW